MIEINELIIYFCDRLQPHPPISSLAWHEVCQSTLGYLNAYRTTTTMLRNLANGATELEAEGKPV